MFASDQAPTSGISNGSASVGGDFRPGQLHSGHDSRIVGFAQRYLIARARSRINVICAYEIYQGFTRGAGRSVMTRAGFGAALAGVAVSGGGARDGDCVTGLCWRENRASLFQPGQEPVPLITGAEAAKARVSMAVKDLGNPVTAFLETRLIEVPGQVTSLEAVKGAVNAAGLSLRDVLACAKARGSHLRTNAWGPAFLTDCQLVAGEGVR